MTAVTAIASSSTIAPGFTDPPTADLPPAAAVDSLPSTPANTAPALRPTVGTVSIALESASLESWLRTLADALGKQFEVAPDVRTASTDAAAVTPAPSAPPSSTLSPLELTIDWCEPGTPSAVDALARATELLSAFGLTLREAEGVLTLERSSPLEPDAALAGNALPLPLQPGTASTDRPTPSDARASIGVVRVIPLVSEWDVASIDALRAILPPSAAITTLPRNSAALVVATPFDADRIERMLQTLDRTDPDGTPKPAISSSVAVFPLRHVDAERATQSMETLLEDVSPAVRLRIAPDTTIGAIALRGPEALLARATRALSLIDASAEERPDLDREANANPSADGADATTFARLSGADPGARITAIDALMTSRLRESTRMIGAPDGRAILAAGDAHGIAITRALAAAIDATRDGTLDARLLRLTTVDPRAATDALRALDDVRARQSADAPPNGALRFDLDVGARELLLVGAPRTVDQALRALRTSLGANALERERAFVSLGRERAFASVTPIPVHDDDSPTASEVRAAACTWADFVQRAGDPLVETAIVPSWSDLPSRLGIAVIDTRVGGVESARTANELTATEDPLALFARSIKVPPTYAVEIADRALATLRAPTIDRDATDATIPSSTDDAHAKPVEPQASPLTIDDATGFLRVRASAPILRALERRVDALRGLRPDRHDARIVATRTLAAETTADALRLLAERPVPIGPKRALSAVSIRTMPSRDAVLLSGEPAYVALFSRLAEALDASMLQVVEEMRTLGMRATEPESIVKRLRARFDARPAQERATQPLMVAADAEGGALAIASHRALLPEILEMLEEMRDAVEPGEARPTVRPREVFSSTLANSDAQTVARALNDLFATPPAPVDASGAELLHLRQPRSAVACADRTTRRVWVESWRDEPLDLKPLLALLDRMELGAGTEVGLVRAERGDVEAAVRTLRDLAARGSLATPSRDGMNATQPIFELEPSSRVVVVVGDVRLRARTEAVLRQLGALPPERVTCIIDVGDADAEALREKIARRAGEDPARAGDAGLVSAADTKHGTLTAIGSRPDVARFAREARSAAAPDPHRPCIARVPLRTPASREFGALLGRLPRGAGELEAALFDRKVDHANDVDAIMLVGSERSVKILAAMASMLDETGVKQPLRAVSRPTLEADVAAAALRAWLEARPADERAAMPVWVDAAPGGGSVLIVAHDAAISSCDDILDGIERASDPGRFDAGAGAARPRGRDRREWRYLPLAGARSGSIASMFGSDARDETPHDAMDDGRRQGATRDRGNAWHAAASAEVGALLVEADSTHAAILASCVAMANAAPATGSFVSVTGSASPAAVALAERARERSGSPPDPNANAGSPLPAAIEIDHANALLTIAGAEPDVSRFAAALREESGIFDPRVAMRVIEVAEADATEFASIARATLARESASRDEADGATRSTAGSLRVRADPAARMIVLLGEPAQVALAEEVVRLLAEAASGESRSHVRLVPLAHAKPSGVADALRARVPDLRVRAADLASAVVMCGTPQALAASEAHLRDLDALPSEAAVLTHVHPLAAADGARVSTLLGAILSEHRLLEIAGGRAKEADEPARVELDARNNAISLRAAPRAMELAKEALAAIEAGRGWPGRSVALVMPSRKRLSALIDQAGAVSDSRLEDEPVLLPLWRSAGLLIVGGNDAVNRRRELLNALDGSAGSRSSIECALLSVDHVDPSVAASAMLAVLGDRDRATPPRSGAVRGASAPVRASAIPWNAARSVLVSASPAQVALAEQVSSLMDAAHEPGRRIDLRAYPIASHEVARAAEAARQALAGRAQAGAGVPATLVPVPAGEALLALGEPSWLDAVDAVVRTIDVRALRDSIRMRTVSVDHRDPGHLGRVVEQLLAADRGDEGGANAADRPEAQEGFAPRMHVDRRRGTITIVGSSMTLDLAEEMLLELDHEPGLVPARSFRLYEFVQAEADLVAKAIEDRFEMDDDDLAPPTVRRQTSRNGLLVRATESQRVVIEAMLSRREPSADEAAADVRTRMIGFVELGLGPRESESVARMLTRAWPSRPEDRTPYLAVALAIDPLTATIACFGDPESVAETMVTARQLRELGSAVGVEALRIELPPSADPQETVTLARATCRQLKEAGGGDDVARAPRAAISADVAGRAAWVTASASECGAVREVVEAIVRSQGAEAVAVQLLPLVRADPTRIAEILRADAVRNEGGLRAAAIPGAVLACGPAREVARAARLAARFDRTATPSDRQVRLVSLRSLSASVAAELLAIAGASRASSLPIEAVMPSALVLSGDAGSLDALSSLLAEIDEPSLRLPTSVVAIPVATRVPSEIVGELRDRLASEGASARDAARIVACDAAGVLFVRADPETLARVRALLALSEP